MSKQQTPIARDDERLREAAARWYVRHEAEMELSALEWQDWETWSSDPEHCAEYDEVVRLHQQARTLVRPALPSKEQIRADDPRIRVFRRLPLWSATSRYSGSGSWRFTAAAAIAGLIFTAVLVAALVTLGNPFKKRPVAVDQVTNQGAAIPFSEATLENLRASGRPVLVNLRSAECGTCVANERTALSRESVQQMMVRKHVAYLKGELTEANPVVSAKLQQFGRPGVPLYLLYCPGTSKPEILPERLTEDIVLTALSSLPDRNIPSL